MGFNIKGTKGSVKAKQNVKDSEVDKETLDFTVQDTGGDVDAEQNIEGVKSSKGWVMVLVALFAAASVYFGEQQLHQDFEVEEEAQVETLEEDRKEDDTQSLAWVLPIIALGIAKIKPFVTKKIKQWL